MSNSTRCTPIVSLLQRLRNNRGFSLFEVVVVLIILGALLAVLLQRITYYQAEAERAQVVKLAANMRAAFNSRLYAAETRGERGKLAAMAGSNPIHLLERAPENYLGEIDVTPTNTVKPGYWYFDRAQRKLVYVFISKKSFRQDSYERWFFRLEFSHIPTGNSKPERGNGLDGSLVLIQADDANR